MKLYLSLSFTFLALLQACLLQCALPVGLGQPKPTFSVVQPGLDAPVPVQLGQNSLARYGAWASLGVTSLIASYMLYKTGVQSFDAALLKLPFFNAYHADTAPALSLLVATPVSAVALMKYGPLAWYFFYMMYAGERMSPVLARNALRDVQVYVQHLHVIKAIQQDLFDIIEQINQAATVPVSADNVQFPAAMPEALQKNVPEIIMIDPAILIELQHALEHDEEYVHEIIQQLQLFLSIQELNEFEQELQIKSAAVVYAIAYELQDQAQAIINVLKISEGQDMGDDAAILNHLIKDLVTYWQNYTKSLADGIDASVRFCNHVHLVEQVIVGWLDRSLLCV